MTKIPIKTRIPIEAWTFAVLVTIFSLIASAVHGPADEASTVFHAKLMQAEPVETSAIR